MPASGLLTRLCRGTGTRPSPGPPPCPAAALPPPAEAAVTLAALPAVIPTPGRRTRGGTSRQYRPRGRGRDSRPGLAGFPRRLDGTCQARQMGAPCGARIMPVRVLPVPGDRLDRVGGAPVAACRQHRRPLADTRRADGRPGLRLLAIIARSRHGRPGLRADDRHARARRGGRIGSCRAGFHPRYLAPMGHAA